MSIRLAYSTLSKRQVGGVWKRRGRQIECTTKKKVRTMANARRKKIISIWLCVSALRDKNWRACSNCVCVADNSESINLVWNLHMTCPLLLYPSLWQQTKFWALSCKRLRSPGIDSASQAGNRSLDSLKGSQIRAQNLKKQGAGVSSGQYVYI